MATLRHTIEIKTPLKTVWDILMDLEQVGHYNPLVASVKILSEKKAGVGASRECQFKPKGSGKERIVEIQDMSSITMEMYESDWPLEFMNWTNTLSETNGYTTLQTETRYLLKFGILGTLLDQLMMKHKFNKILSELFASLKNYAEAQYGNR